MKLWYNDVIHWKKNLFKAPHGNVGDCFVSEIARLFQSYANFFTFESVALYATMVMPPTKTIG